MTARSGGVVVEPKRYLEEAARAAGIEDPEPVAVEGRLAASAIDGSTLARAVLPFAAAWARDLHLDVVPGSHRR